MVQATDLPAMDMGGVSDPYVKVGQHCMENSVARLGSPIVDFIVS